MAGSNSDRGDDPGAVDIGEDDTCEALSTIPVDVASRPRKTPVSRDARPSAEDEDGEKIANTDTAAPDTQRSAKQILQRERPRG